MPTEHCCCCTLATHARTPHCHDAHARTARAHACTTSAERTRDRPWHGAPACCLPAGAPLLVAVAARSPAKKKKTVWAKKDGEAGFRSRCLVNANDALCQLSYSPPRKKRQGAKTTQYIACRLCAPDKICSTPGAGDQGECETRGAPATLASSRARHRGCGCRPSPKRIPSASPFPLARSVAKAAARPPASRDERRSSSLA